MANIKRTTIPTTVGTFGVQQPSRKDLDSIRTNYESGISQAKNALDQVFPVSTGRSASPPTTTARPGGSGIDWDNVQPVKQGEFGRSEDMSTFLGYEGLPVQLDEKREPGGLYNALMRGQLGARQAFNLAVTGELNDIVALQAKQANYPISEQEQAILQDLSKANLVEAIYGLITKPKIAALVSAESFLPSIVAISAGSALGAGIGMATGSPVGGLIGAGVGAGTGSAIIEYSSLISERLRESGVDFSDEQSIANKLMEEEFMGNVRKEALKKGVPIGIVDGVSFGLAGKLFRIVKGTDKYIKNIKRATRELNKAKTKGQPIDLLEKNLTKAAIAGEKAEAGIGLARTGAAAVAELLGQSVMGGVGETAGQLSAYGKITSQFDIAAEMVAELPTGAIEAVAATTIGKSTVKDALPKDIKVSEPEYSGATKAAEAEIAAGEAAAAARLAEKEAAKKVQEEVKTLPLFAGKPLTKAQVREKEINVKPEEKSKAASKLEEIKARRDDIKAKRAAGKTGPVLPAKQEDMFENLIDNPDDAVWEGGPLVVPSLAEKAKRTERRRVEPRKDFKKIEKETIARKQARTAEIEKNKATKKIVQKVKAIEADKALHEKIEKRLSKLKSTSPAVKGILSLVNEPVETNTIMQNLELIRTWATRGATLAAQKNPAAQKHFVNLQEALTEFVGGTPPASNLYTRQTKSTKRKRRGKLTGFGEVLQTAINETAASRPTYPTTPQTRRLGLKKKRVNRSASGKLGEMLIRALAAADVAEHINVNTRTLSKALQALANKNPVQLLEVLRGTSEQMNKLTKHKVPTLTIGEGNQKLDLVGVRTKLSSPQFTKEDLYHLATEEPGDLNIGQSGYGLGIKGVSTKQTKEEIITAIIDHWVSTATEEAQNVQQDDTQKFAEITDTLAKYEAELAVRKEEMKQAAKREKQASFKRTAAGRIWVALGNIKRGLAPTSFVASSIETTPKKKPWIERKPTYKKGKWTNKTSPERRASEFFNHIAEKAAAKVAKRTDSGAIIGAEKAWATVDAYLATPSAAEYIAELAGLAGVEISPRERAGVVGKRVLSKKARQRIITELKLEEKFRSFVYRDAITKQGRASTAELKRRIAKRLQLIGMPSSYMFTYAKEIAKAVANSKAAYKKAKAKKEAKRIENERKKSETELVNIEEQVSEEVVPLTPIETVQVDEFVKVFLDSKTGLINTFTKRAKSVSESLKLDTLREKAEGALRKAEKSDAYVAPISLLLNRLDQIQADLDYLSTAAPDLVRNELFEKVQSKKKDEVFTYDLAEVASLMENFNAELDSIENSSRGLTKHVKTIVEEPVGGLENASDLEPFINRIHTVAQARVVLNNFFEALTEMGKYMEGGKATHKQRFGPAWLAKKGIRTRKFKTERALGPVALIVDGLKNVPTKQGYPSGQLWAEIKDLSPKQQLDKMRMWVSVVAFYASPYFSNYADVKAAAAGIKKESKAQAKARHAKLKTSLEVSELISQAQKYRTGVSLKDVTLHQEKRLITYLRGRKKEQRRLSKDHQALLDDLLARRERRNVAIRKQKQTPEQQAAMKELLTKKELDKLADSEPEFAEPDETAKALLGLPGALPDFVRGTEDAFAAIGEALRLKGVNLGAILSGLETDNKDINAVLRAIQAVGVNRVPVHLVAGHPVAQERASGISGAYNTEADEIVIGYDSNNPPSAAALGFALLHEAVHAVTTRRIANSKPLETQLRNILRQVKAALGDNVPVGLQGVFDSKIAGTKDIYEFVTVVFADPSVRTALAGIQLTENATGWQRFINWLKRVFHGSLDNTALQAVLALQPEIFGREGTARIGTLNLEQAAADREGFNKRVSRFHNAIARIRLLGGMTGRQIEKWPGWAELFKTTINGEARDLLSELFNFQHIKWALSNKLGQEGDVIVRRMAGYQYKTPIAAGRLFSVMLNATRLGIHPDVVAADKSNAHMFDKNGKIKAEFKDDYIKLRTEFKQLDKEGQDIYAEAKSYFEKEWKATTKELEDNVLRTFGFDQKVLDEITTKGKRDWSKLKIKGEDLSPQQQQALRALLERNKMAFGPYFPMRRFGDWVISYTYSKTLTADTAEQLEALIKRQERVSNVDTNLLGGVPPEVSITADGKYTTNIPLRGVEFFENEGVAHDRRAELLTDKRVYDNRKDGEGKPLEKISLVDRKQQRDSFDSAIGTGIIKDVTDLLNKQVKTDEEGGSNKAQIDMLATALRQVYLARLPDTSLRKAEMRRKNTLGYTNDIPRSFAAYVRSSSYFRAQIQYGWRLRDAMEEMATLIKKTAGKKNLPEASKANQQKVSRMRDIFNELYERDKQESLLIQETPYADYVNGAAFIWFLGTASYSIVNASQPFMFTLPYLGAKYKGGTFKAPAALMRAMKAVSPAIIKQSFKSGFGLTSVSGAAVSKSFNVIEDVKKNVGKSKYANKAQLVNMLDELVNNGLADLTFNLSLREVSEGKVNNFTKALDVVRTMPHLIEVLNRAVTAIAAYEMETSQSKLTGEALHKAGVQAAIDAVAETQFDYSSANKARWMSRRGGLGKYASSIFMFKQHVQHVYMAYIKAIFQVYSGKGENGRKEGAYLLANLFVTHSIMVGLGGAVFEPIAFAVGAVLSAFSDDPEWPDEWEAQVRKAAYDLTGSKLASRYITRGMFSTAIGGLPERIGVTRMLARPLMTTSSEDTFKESLFQLIGPLGGVAAGMFRAYDNYWVKGNPTRALEAFVPKQMRDVMQAQRFWKEGMLTASGEVIYAYDSMSPLDFFQKIVGFTPPDVGEAYASRGAQLKLKNKMLARKSKLMARGRRELQTKGRLSVELKNDLRTYNKDVNKIGGVRGARLMPHQIFRSYREVNRRGGDLAYFGKTTRGFKKAGEPYDL